MIELRKLSLAVVLAGAWILIPAVSAQAAGATPKQKNFLRLVKATQVKATHLRSTDPVNPNLTQSQVNRAAKLVKATLLRSTDPVDLNLTQNQVNRAANRFASDLFNLKSFVLLGIPKSQVLAAENQYLSSLLSASLGSEQHAPLASRNDRVDRVAAVENYLFTVNSLQATFFTNVSTDPGTLNLTQSQVNRAANTFARDLFNLKSFGLLGIPKSQVLAAENQYLSSLLSASRI